MSPHHEESPASLCASEGKKRERVASSEVEDGNAVGVEGEARRGEASQIKVSPSLIPPVCSCAESASKENQPLQMSAGEDLG